MGPFCCHGNHSFSQICLKTLNSQSHNPTMIHIKFEDCPTGLGDKYESVDRRHGTNPIPSWTKPCEPSGAGKLSNTA